MSDYDKRVWQEEQAARDAALEVQRDKWAKAKARAARNAQRKIDRLARKLSESGQLTDWEEEFTESVGERLDKFGSAFHDPEKGRPADALSFSQKKIVAALNKKVKEQKKTANFKPDEAAEMQAARNPHADPKQKYRKPLKAKSAFGRKSYQPRIRQLDEELGDEPVHEGEIKIQHDVKTIRQTMSVIDSEPFIPEITPTDHKPPFLRLVK